MWLLAEQTEKRKSLNTFCYVEDLNIASVSVSQTQNWIYHPDLLFEETGIYHAPFESPHSKCRTTNPRFNWFSVARRGVWHVTLLKVTASMNERSNRQAICTPRSCPRMEKVLRKSLLVHILSTPAMSHTVAQHFTPVSMMKTMWLPVLVLHHLNQWLSTRWSVKDNS